ncbi:MAG TPA: hypothetical protein VFV20_01080, partial [Candidatus Limnocylindria bacterium]|nr:hypothetical protein [Candidatus Limnocylindria bacterium]
LPQRDAVQPAFDVPIVLRRPTESLLESIVEGVESGVTVEQRRDEGAVDVRESIAVQHGPAFAVRRSVHMLE